jgi:tripartite-type tricarboxylate transporter receptor subunit TctC
MPQRTLALAIGLAIALSALSPEAGAQQAWPAKQVRIIVPFAPGGATDIIARMLGSGLGSATGGTFVVDNRPGGGGIPAFEAVIRAEGDGHTLGLLASSYASSVSLTKSLRYDPRKDIAPVTIVARSTSLILVPAASPIKSFAELMAQAKEKPDTLSYAHTGVGTAQHFAGEQFKLRTGLKIPHVPYKGAGPALNDLIGGQVPMGVIGIGPTRPLIESGKLRALAITTSKRSALLPNVPTLAELGVKDFDVGEWFGAFTSGTTPPVIVNRIAAEIAKVAGAPAFSAALSSQGIEVETNSPEAFRAFVSGEIDRLGEIARAASIQAH